MMMQLLRLGLLVLVGLEVFVVLTVALPMCRLELNILPCLTVAEKRIVLNASVPRREQPWSAQI